MGTLSPAALLINADNEYVYTESYLTDLVQGRIFSFMYEGNASNVETPAALFRNPAGSGKDFIIARLLLDTVSKVQSSTMRIYAMPTILTVGSAIVCGSRRLKGTPPASAALAYSLPTVSANGLKALVLSTGYSNPTLIDDVSRTVLVGPGYDLLMTVQATANNSLFSVTAAWLEIASV